MEHSRTVSIRPGVSMLSILKHIEYDPWFALAEFVDNAIDSYTKYEKELKIIEGNDFQLEVKIELNDIDKKITIKDNAAGIHQKDYARAFRAAEIPPDNSGLSEFGMGMKSASCWFSDNWSVRTTALGENIEKTVSFDLNKIYYDKIEELEVISKPQKENLHYTIIELTGINKMPIKKTKGKIKEHLTSIYRHFTRNGILKLYLDNDLLEYKDPAILNAPFPHDSKSESIYWKKEIDFEIDGGKMYVKGFVGLLEKMETGKNGFALFRRGRVIEGSGDDGFTPKEIMGQTGSPEWKRIFGELHLEGFNVTFTKKGIKWDENMEVFLDLLKSDLNQPTFPLLKQARNYTKNPTKAEMKQTAEAVVKTTVEEMKQNIQPAINHIRSEPIATSEITSLTKTEEVTTREFEIEFNDTKWLVSIELSYDEDITDWIEIGSHVLKNKTTNKTLRQVGVRMSLNHPFVIHFAGTDKSKLEPILRIAAAIGLAEEAAREACVPQAGTVRMNLNKLLTAISRS
ncbi:MAG TPA: ATP-binding protein [Cytophagaceae bacterium]|jgi:hypothetical protein|nr:ATP-binding protein [Cytophagaceae bacterium]